MKSWLRRSPSPSEGMELLGSNGESKHHASSITTGDREGWLNDNFKTLGDHAPRWLQQPVGYLASRSRRFWAIVGATALLVLLLFSAASTTKPKPVQHVYGSINKPSAATELSGEDHELYILIPSSQVNLKTCKTILSSSVLGYPTTWLVDWDMKLNGPNKVRERTLAKLNKIRRFLHDLGSRRQNETVMILDEPNALFQLRPDTLMQRYLNINHEANTKLARAYGGSDALEKIGIKQNIVFAAQKQCASNLTGTPICNAAPLAPEPLNTRYLGSGMHMGTIKDMLALYDYACERGADSTVWNSEHTLMTIIFGEQEQQRKRFRDSGDWPALTTPRNATTRLPQEFYIGLDYAGALSTGPAATADLASLRHDGHPESDSRPLSADIFSSTPPFWSLAGDGSAGFPDTTSWANVSLLSHPQTHTTPALVAFSASDDTSAAATDAAARGWEQLWFAPFARPLLTTAALIADMPRAIVVDPASGLEHRFWSPSMSFPGIKSVNLDFHAWTDVCGADEWVPQLFGDALGPWKDPHY